MRISLSKEDELWIGPARVTITRIGRHEVRLVVVAPRRLTISKQPRRPRRPDQPPTETGKTGGTWVDQADRARPSTSPAAGGKADTGSTAFDVLRPLAFVLTGGVIGLSVYWPAPALGVLAFVAGGVAAVVDVRRSLEAAVSRRESAFEEAAARRHGQSWADEVSRCARPGMHGGTGTGHTGEALRLAGGGQR